LQLRNLAGPLLWPLPFAKTVGLETIAITGQENKKKELFSLG